MATSSRDVISVAFRPVGIPSRQGGNWGGFLAGAVALAGLALGGCMGSVSTDDSGTGGRTTQSGTGGTNGGMPAAGTGGGAAPTPGGTGGATGTPVPGGTGGTVVVQCNSIAPGRAPIRRLTTYEYNNTVRDLLRDTTNPGTSLPAQVDSKENWFGNDADEQAPSPLLVEKYNTVAEGIAMRATANTTALAALHSCASSLTTANEEACARMIATAVAPRAYRRTATMAEIDELVTLYKTVRGLGATATFASGVAAMLEAMLQSPEFLYRVELGTAVSGNANVKKITGREMATRLSYLFWQTMPDPALTMAADAGMLDTKEGVLEQARKLLDDQKSRPMVAFFFDNFLPIPDLAGQVRDKAQYPTWTSAIGADMRREVQELLKHEIYENTQQSAPPYGAGSWPAILTVPYTFVNQALFNYYGASTFASGTTVTGTALQKVGLNTTQRLGLLTLGGITAGGTTSNHTNPVLRGTFIINKLMCRHVELPTGFTPPQIDPYSGKTARERVAKHTSNVVCAECHKAIDPLGLPFENYDAVGLYRTSEKWTDKETNMTHDTPIDASGSVPGVPGTAKDGVELVKLLATSEEVNNCFAGHWMRFAYGRTLEEADACNRQSVQMAFKSAGYNVKQLLLALTQTDAFLYRPAQ